MNKYIEQNVIIETFRKDCPNPTDLGNAQHFINIIKNISAANVRPVVLGKWVHGREVGREYIGNCLVGIFYDKWTCSECGYIVDDYAYSKINYNFCPNCGADMKEVHTDGK